MPSTPRFDVCVLPWDTEQTFTSYGSAIKFGSPATKARVISPLPEYESMHDVLQIARSRDEFFSLVTEALEERNPDAASKATGISHAWTWDARAEGSVN